jgi:hypothetical protein
MMQERRFPGVALGAFLGIAGGEKFSQSNFGRVFCVSGRQFTGMFAV